MVHPVADETRMKYKSAAEIPDFTQHKLSDQDRQDIFQAQPYIMSEFYSFLRVLQLQFMKIVSSINKKYPEMLIITHGYDYPYPSYSRKFDWRYPLKFLINGFVDSGKWLVRPLRIKGIHDPELQRKILKAFIYELNYMLDELVYDPKYYNFFRVHTIGTAKSQDDWYDELHLKSHNYELVAQMFEKAIASWEGPQREIRQQQVTREEVFEGMTPAPPVMAQKDFSMRDIKKEK